MIRGSCLCQRVRFRFKRTVGDYVLCHCPSCRKASGGAYAANVSVPVDEFEFIKGESEMATFESSPGKLRYFCKHCGSPLYTRVGAAPAYHRVRLGCLDSVYQQLPAAHIFVGLKAHWHQPSGSIPSFLAFRRI